MTIIMIARYQKKVSSDNYREKLWMVGIRSGWIDVLVAENGKKQKNKNCWIITWLEFSYDSAMTSRGGTVGNKWVFIGVFVWYKNIMGWWLICDSERQKMKI